MNVRAGGAAGDGLRDDTRAIQEALDRQGEVIIPSGRYRIGGTLRLGSRTRIQAAPDAVLFSDSATEKREGDFLLTCREGSDTLGIHGGVWDGSFGPPFNRKPADIFCPNGWSGAVLNFVGARGLELCDLQVANSVTYNIRLSRVEDFRIRNVAFFARERSYNQDGIHLGGGCRRGRIENIRAVSRGQTNDDLLALNADDSVERIENRGLIRGGIEDITARGLYAEDCHTILRMLSVDAPIRRIRIEEVEAGCRCYAVNMDAARYCATPLFREDQYPGGVGRVEDVTLRRFTYWATGGNPAAPLLMLETRANRFRMEQVTRDESRDCQLSRPSLAVGKVAGLAVTVEGVRTVLPAASAGLTRQEGFTQLWLDRAT